MGGAAVGRRVVQEREEGQYLATTTATHETYGEIRMFSAGNNAHVHFH